MNTNINHSSFGKMKKNKITPLVFLLLSCNQTEISKLNNTNNQILNKEISSTVKLQNSNNFNKHEIEVFDVRKMLFNGKLKRLFTLEEFYNVFGNTDSTKLMLDEEPCSYYFENSDGSKDKDDKYLFKNGSRFENNKNNVVVDEFRFLHNNYIKYDSIIFNSSTTVNDLKKIFPNAMREISLIDVYGEGKLHVIQLREDENNISDGHINLFIKNNKLFYIHWWFPC